MVLEVVLSVGNSIRVLFHGGWHANDGHNALPS